MHTVIITFLFNLRCKKKYKGKKNTDEKWKQRQSIHMPKYFKGSRFSMYSKAFRNINIDIELRNRLNIMPNPSNAVNRANTNA
jgi:hypothetical protein